MMLSKITFNLLERILVSRMNRLVGEEGDKGHFLGLRSYLQSEQSLSLGSIWKKIRLRFADTGNAKNENFAISRAGETEL